MHGRDDRDHVAVAVEMLGLVEDAMRLARDIAEMHEIDARREGADHLDEVVVGARAVGADAEGEAVAAAVIGIEERGGIGGGRDDARQAEERDRRIVRMDGEADAGFLGDRHDLVEEFAEALEERARAHVAILAHEVEEFRPVVGEVGAGKAGEDDPLELRLARFRHRLETRLGGAERRRRRSRRRRPARFRTKTS